MLKALELKFRERHRHATMDVGNWEPRMESVSFGRHEDDTEVEAVRLGIQPTHKLQEVLEKVKPRAALKRVRRYPS